MTASSSPDRFSAWFDAEVVHPIEDFQNPKQEWRRLFSEFLGTFFLVLVAAGGGMMGQAFPDTISRTAAVTAPALMVMAIILFMGKVSGAHLNPAVSIAFWLRGDFPTWRVPGYIVVQLGGATLAALFLQHVIDVSAIYGSNYPSEAYSSGAAFWMELILTFGLVNVILGTASGAQNIGVVGAFGVGGYIALAGLWGSPISGASMNPLVPSAPTSSVPTSASTGCTWPDRSPARCWPSGPRSCCAGEVVAAPARPRPKVTFSPRLPATQPEGEASEVTMSLTRSIASPWCCSRTARSTTCSVTSTAPMTARRSKVSSGRT
jgi:aquaporin Z